jgi:autotransporter-associated beta strand protein
MIAQDAGSTGTVVIGDGPGSNGAFIAARTFTGGSGTASVVFTQQYAASPGTNPVYPFSTTLTGSLGIVQAGTGTTLLQPLYGANTFSGPVTVNSGTLATAGTAAALAGVTEITVNSAATLMLGQTQGVNDLAGLHLAGGVLQTGTGLFETFGGLIVSGSTAAIDFLGNAATLNFATLDLGGHLSIWNYSGTTDFFEIATGTATGSLEQISFYSDAGTTFLGYGGFESTRIVPVAVPEPSTIVMALAGLAACGMMRWRRKRVASPRVSSPASGAA